MKKPAIFIDAFLSDEKRHELFNYNVVNFIKNDWDVFIISNKIFHFNSFAGVKYFEYDTTNRLLGDRSKYNLVNGIYLTRTMYDGMGNEFKLNVYHPAHSITNWSLLYNLRRIADVLKSKNYTHLIMCEYDLTFKRYDLMNTVFKDFGKTENSKKCMISRGDFGYPAMTSLYLVGVDEVIKKIPIMNTEDDYMMFIRNIYGDNTSPAYEKLFPDIFLKPDVNGNPTEGEIIPEEIINEAQDRTTMVGSEIGDNRFPTIKRAVMMMPINNNTSFFMQNDGQQPVFVEYSTNGYNEVFKLGAGVWRTFSCADFVRVQTSDMIRDNDERYFDLSTFKCEASFTPV
jgi:hypothetical protein